MGANLEARRGATGGTEHFCTEASAKGGEKRLREEEGRGEAGGKLHGGMDAWMHGRMEARWGSTDRPIANARRREMRREIRTTAAITLPGF